VGVVTVVAYISYDVIRDQSAPEFAVSRDTFDWRPRFWLYAEVAFMGWLLFYAWYISFRSSAL